MSPRFTRTVLPFTFLALAGLVAAPVGCSNEPDFDGGGSGNCRTVSTSACGVSCSSTSDCESGLFCDAKLLTCQADCPAGTKEASDCNGAACLSDGQCSGASDKSTGRTTISVTGIGGGGGGPGDTNEECIDVQVDFSPQIPNVVLLIDQSGSMDDRDGFGAAVQAEIDADTYTPWGCGGDNDTWRWNVVRNVLFNPTAGVVKPLEDKVRFGLALYTSSDGFGLSEPYRTCPVLVEVGIDFGTHQEMLDAMDCDDKRGDTPTRESLRDTANALAAADIEGPKVLVLATDGEPDSCACPNWDDSDGYDCDADMEDWVERDGTSMSLANAERYDLIEEARRIQVELGITVHVIDVSTPTNTALRAHLTDVAAGGGGDIFDGTKPSGLTDAFNTIIDGVRSCKIDLDGEISPGKESTGVIRLDGTTLKLGDANGWKKNTATQIELTGTACETIKVGEHDLDISFPCGAFVVPVTK